MAGHTDNSVIIDAPMDLVWEMTNDLTSWPQLFSEYAAVEVLERHEHTFVFRLTMHPDELGRVWTWVSERTLDAAARTVRAHRIETGPFEYMKLAWSYTQESDGVRMRWVQDFTMKSGAHTDDVGMTEHLNTTTRKEQARIKGLVEKAALENEAAAAEPDSVGFPDDPHAQRLLLLGGGARVAAIVRALGGLGVADLLAEGPRTVVDLATAVDVDPDALARVLRAAAAVGIFAELPGGRVGLTPLAEGLRSHGPQSIASYVQYSGARFVHRPYEQLQESIRTGKPATTQALGSGLWDYLAANPSDAELFDTNMAGMSARLSRVFADRIAAERFPTIADIGGGTGDFLVTLLLRNPGARGVLVERPHVLAAAAPYIAAAGMSDRIECVAADFMTDELPRGCDAYVLRTVLHNWSDPDAATVLRRVRESIGNGRLFVCEQVLSEAPGWDHAKFLDVDMLVLFGGRERTLREWNRLLNSAGFELVQHPGKPGWAVLECAATA
ncbi:MULTISPECIES: methyltransferase [unclassified Nocardia]|uniref:methyltransferase n=1 Tax=unclassified Nocardia TaxID=2637762 RepID=UPI0035E25D67